jgi:hypothetical protein
MRECIVYKERPLRHAAPKGSFPSAVHDRQALCGSSAACCPSRHSAFSRFVRIGPRFPTLLGVVVGPQRPAGSHPPTLSLQASTPRPRRATRARCTYRRTARRSVPPCSAPVLHCPATPTLDVSFATAEHCEHSALNASPQSGDDTKRSSPRLTRLHLAIGVEAAETLSTEGTGEVPCCVLQRRGFPATLQ